MPQSSKSQKEVQYKLHFRIIGAMGNESDDPTPRSYEDCFIEINRFLTDLNTVGNPTFKYSSSLQSPFIANIFRDNMRKMRNHVGLYAIITLVEAKHDGASPSIHMVSK